MVETRFQTSFIPKKPVASGVSYRSESSGMGALTLIGVLLIVIAGLTSGGLFLYEQSLEKNIAYIDAELVEKRDLLDQDALATFIDLGKKTGNAEMLLNRHVSFSKVTDFFEGIVLRNVRLADITAEISPGKSMKVAFKGEAQGYAAVASQVDALRKANHVTSVEVSNMTLNEKGNVTFSSIVNFDTKIFEGSTSSGEVSFVGTIQ